MNTQSTPKRTLNSWTLTYHDWNPEQQPLREALCTLGNGYLATRGAAEEMSAGGPHYPGTYMAGGYNRRASQVADRSVDNEDLVNWPNWLCLSMRADDGDWLDIAQSTRHEFRQELDMQAGILTRSMRFADAQGREFELVSRRIMHMQDPNVAAIEWTLTCRNWSGAVEIRSALDGTVRNSGVARYRQLEGQHLTPLEAGPLGEDGMLLVVESNQSHIRMAQAARTLVRGQDGEQVPVQRSTDSREGYVAQHLRVPCEANTPLRIEKLVAIVSSRDRAISEPGVAVHKRVQGIRSFAELERGHRHAWAELWRRANICVDAPNGETQGILRFHIFHLLQTTSIHTIDQDVGVPARGLHGEAYRGHIFWDELFIFPFLNLRIPELTRALLMYRYRRLPEARVAAQLAGFRGAMFPWQSGSDGQEESQELHLNPRSGRWLPDTTHRQRHVNAAIVYNVWQYYQASDDKEFLSFYGAELILEIGRFWASIACLNPKRGRYEIYDVVGPDEFHTHYPDSDGSRGLNNNAYTNVMAAWCLQCALAVQELLAEERQRELFERLGIDAAEIARWEDVSRRMFVPFGPDGVIEQFEGFHQLEELDWQGLRERHGTVQRLDRLLEAQGDDPNRYKAAKQADVLMLFYLFSDSELHELFARLGYRLEPQDIPITIDYYLSRTSHGSTLSRVVHSWVLARTMRERSWELYRAALYSDIEDIQGGTTSEGIHLGAMAGTVDLVQRCYSGIEARQDILWLNPCLPDEVTSMELCIRYRGHWLELVITHEQMRVSFERGWSHAVRIGFRGQVYEMEQGSDWVFELHDSSSE